MVNKKFKSLIAAAGIAAAAFSAGALATVTTVPQSALVSSNQYYTDTIGGGIGHTVMPRNDDGSTSSAINLGFTLNFYGQDYTKFWINNNGNITFTGPEGTYTPAGPQGVPEPIISPFFADVDTRGDGSGQVYLRNDITGEIIVTWDAVGYYAYHTDKLDSFQLVLRGPGYSIPTGQGSIGFFYKDMQWETGDASNGSGGFGGTPAAVGFGNGSGDGIVLAGSTQDGISGVVDNHHIWFDQNLAPVNPPVNPPTGVPEPPEIPLILFGLLAMGGLLYLRRRRAS